MSFHPGYKCDTCEKPIAAEQDAEILEEGWLMLKFWTGEDDTSQQDRDFCSLRCLIMWATRGALNETRARKIDDIWRASGEET